MSSIGANGHVGAKDQGWYIISMQGWEETISMGDYYMGNNGGFVSRIGFSDPD